MEVAQSCRRFTRWLQRKAADIPVFGPLVYCHWKHHKASLVEMSVIFFFSTATFWLTSILMMGSQPIRNLGWLNALQSTVQGGELFIFSVGFLGPILLLTMEDKVGDRQFPGRLWHTLMLIGICLVAAAFHAQTKGAQIQNILQTKEDIDWLFSVSIWVAVAAVVLRYLAMVYRKSTSDPDKEIKSQEVGFVAKYAKHVQDGEQS